MTHLTIHKDRVDEAVDKAVDILQTGGVIAYPTETFYGLGARFDVSGALQRLYDLKRRPKEKAMPLIIGGVELLPMIVSRTCLENAASIVELLIERFWPGPLTLLLTAEEGLSEYLSAGTGKVAVRVPGESFALHLAKKAGFPITATSANLSGKPSSVSAEDVVRYFGDKIDLLIDGGTTQGGLPSTIVDASGGVIEIVREGVISRKVIEKFLAQSR